jgi:hypothetical protein
LYRYVKVNELTLQNEYQLRLKDLNMNEKIKDLSDKFQSELDGDKTKFELLLQEKNEQEMEYEVGDSCVRVAKSSCDPQRLTLVSLSFSFSLSRLSFLFLSSLSRLSLSSSLYLSLVCLSLSKPPGSSTLEKL